MKKVRLPWRWRQ